MGYTPWEIIYIVSFTTGEMKKLYGMTYVDRDNVGNRTMARSKKILLTGIKKSLNRMEKTCKAAENQLGTSLEVSS